MISEMLRVSVRGQKCQGECQGTEMSREGAKCNLHGFECVCQRLMLIVHGSEINTKENVYRDILRCTRWGFIQEVKSKGAVYGKQDINM